MPTQRFPSRIQLDGQRLDPGLKVVKPSCEPSLQISAMHVALRFRRSEACRSTLCILGCRLRLTP